VEIKEASGGLSCQSAAIEVSNSIKKFKIN
jgi:hypothetical protein